MRLEKRLSSLQATKEDIQKKERLLTMELSGIVIETLVSETEGGPIYQIVVDFSPNDDKDLTPKDKEHYQMKCIYDVFNNPELSCIVPSPGDYVFFRGTFDIVKIAQNVETYSVLYVDFATTIALNQNK